MVSAMISLALLAVLWLGTQLAGVVISRHRAEGAADLAALAVAAHAPQGAERACARAEWIVREMRAGLTSCQLRGWEARVEVRDSPAGAHLPFLVTHARARAGPVGG